MVLDWGDLPAQPPPPAPSPPPPIADATPPGEAPIKPFAALPPPTNLATPPTLPIPASYPPFAPPEVFDEPDTVSPQPNRARTAGGDRTSTRPAHWKRRIAIGAALLVAGVAAAVIVPRVLKPTPITAVFNAPRLILRAAGDGQIGAVAVKVGDTVQPNTDLLTIRPDPVPTPTTIALHTQWDAIRARAATLDAAMAQSQANAGDSGRLRRDEQQRLLGTAAAEIEQIQRTLIANTPEPPPAATIQAGVRGMVASLDAQPGMHMAARATLVQLLDCGRAFLSLRPGGPALHAGDSVQISLPPLPPFVGTVRASAGISEPVNALVIAPTGLPAAVCPVGQIATITPADSTHH